MSEMPPQGPQFQTQQQQQEGSEETLPLYEQSQSSEENSSEGE